MTCRTKVERQAAGIQVLKEAFAAMPATAGFDPTNPKHRAEAAILFAFAQAVDNAYLMNILNEAATDDLFVVEVAAGGIRRDNMFPYFEEEGA